MFWRFWGDIFLYQQTRNLERYIINKYDPLTDSLWVQAEPHFLKQIKSAKTSSEANISQTVLDCL